MPEDLFFTRSELRLLRPAPTLNARCDRCGLYKAGCRSPKMKPWGRGEKGVLIVSDYPGKTEDADGRPFAGSAGRFLADCLARFDFDLERDAWSTNALICHDVHKHEPKTAIDDCRPNLLRTVAELKPAVVVLAGGFAVQSLIGHVWKPDPGPLVRWTGRRIPAHKPNAWLCPVNNPAFVMRDTTEPVTKLQFREQLGAAVALAAGGPPWAAAPPDYAKLVEVILSPSEAARRLARYRSGALAFDFESTTLKPDGPHAELVCCGVCWEGRETIAFPWHGAVVPEMRRILADPAIGKIASNLDMEMRWVLAKMGFEVNNWAADTMLGAHCLDPRPGGKEKEDGTATGSGTTGLKFQAFIRLGQPEYNSHLEDHLRGTEPGGNSPNRIREVKIETTLKYCGMDALLEYLVAADQAEEMGTTL